MKTVLKLVAAALVANAIWHVGSTYASYFKFKDAATDAVTNNRAPDDQLKDRLAAIAAMYDVPISADDLSIRHEGQHTYVDASYTKPISLFPGFDYQWPFTVSIDGFVITPETSPGSSGQ